MKAGDRVMVFDSPGFPVDHYLYATVLTPADAGALVIVDHPGNLSHAQQRYVPAAKILRAGDATRLADEMKAEAAKQTDGGKRQYYLEHVKGLQFMAEQLAE